MVPAQPKVDFFGFPKFACPACQKWAKYPLATPRMVIYAVIALVALGWSIKILASGAIPIFGVIPALMLAAVIIDFGVRARLGAARKRWQAKQGSAGQVG
jgi:hypothetical protein